MRKADNILSTLFRDHFGPDFFETVRSSAGLFSSWAQIVTEVWPAVNEQNNDEPPAVAAHSKIKELEKGLLLVEADHPGWIQILQTKQRELLSVAKKRHPEMNIRNISFRLNRESTL